jgi:hypothetical protein
MRYTLGRPLSAVAVSPDLSTKTIVFIPEGAVLEIPSDAPEFGFVDASWEGRSIQVFAEDVRARGSMVDAARC